MDDKMNSLHEKTNDTFDETTQIIIDLTGNTSDDEETTVTTHHLMKKRKAENEVEYDATIETLNEHKTIFKHYISANSLLVSDTSDDENEPTITRGLNFETGEWHCLSCGENMGEHNPRQLCGKTFCRNST